MSDYINDDLTASTSTDTGPKWKNQTINDLMRWLREESLDDADAAWQAHMILAEYDERKTAWERIKCLFV